jgi:hypothetical protein
MYELKGFRAGNPFLSKKTHACLLIEWIEANSIDKNKALNQHNAKSNPVK